MTNKELVENLMSHFVKVRKMLTLGNLELLKSDELYTAKYSIEDMLNIYKPFFSEVIVLKIEKVISKERTPHEDGIFLEARIVNSELQDIYVLLKELIKDKDDSKQINLDSVTRASGF
ncbi:MAG: hypothetical protein WA057_04785 [Candidatus Magasanikiibacteriota bacterium]